MGEQFEKNDHPFLPGTRLEQRLIAGAGALGDLDRIIGPIVDRPGQVDDILAAAANTQTLDHRIGHDRRFLSDPDQSDCTPGGADSAPVIEAPTKPYEEIARKHRLGHHLIAAGAALSRANLRPEDLQILVSQVMLGAAVLARFAEYSVPVAHRIVHFGIHWAKTVRGDDECSGNEHCAENCIDWASLNRESSHCRAVSSALSDNRSAVAHRPNPVA